MTCARSLTFAKNANEWAPGRHKSGAFQFLKYLGAIEILWV